MIRSAALMVAVSVCVALTTATLQGQGAFILSSLTVPSDRLAGVGCELSPADSVRVGGNRVRGGLWAGLPLSSNPWTGNDPIIVAAIRERVVGSPPSPDGPPLSRSELARFRLQLAGDVEEAYAAIYAHAGSGLIAVQAVRFKETAKPTPERERTTAPGLLAFEVGRTVVIVSGEQSNCLEAVRNHITAITSR